jgi:hypothetical protein
MLIITAWHSISPEMTVKGFKNCCVSSAADGTDEGMLWNSSAGWEHHASQMYVA